MNQDVIYELLQDRMKCAPNVAAVIDEQRSLTRMELEQLIDTIAVKIPTEAGKAVLEQSFRFAVFPKQMITFNPMQYGELYHHNYYKEVQKLL